MKIAYVLSGQPRNFTKGYEIISAFLKQQSNIEVDFFFHCWTLTETQTYKTSPFRTISTQDVEYKNTIKDDLLRLYNPKAYAFETQRENFNEIQYLDTLAYTQTPDWLKKNTYNTLSNFYSKTKARDLFHEYSTLTNTNYDCVIYSRFDLYNEINIVLDKLDLSCTYVSDLPIANPLIPDFFIVCPQDCFLSWFTFYDNLKHILDNHELNARMIERKMNIVLCVEQIFTSSFLFHNKTLDKVVYSKEIPNFIFI
jgi:hypothetical protein